MNRSGTLVLLEVAAMAVFVAACGSPGSAPPSPTSVTTAAPAAVPTAPPCAGPSGSPGATSGPCVDRAYVELVSSFGQDIEGIGGALGHGDPAEALREANLAASEARELYDLLKTTRPEVGRRFLWSAQALDHVVIALNEKSDPIGWYQAALAHADVARDAVSPNDPCPGAS